LIDEREQSDKEPLNIPETQSVQEVRELSKELEIQE